MHHHSMSRSTRDIKNIGILHVNNCFKFDKLYLRGHLPHQIANYQISHLYFLIERYGSSSLLFLFFLFELCWLLVQISGNKISWNVEDIDITPRYGLRKIQNTFIILCYNSFILPGNRPSPRWLEPFHQLASLLSIIITERNTFEIL